MKVREITPTFYHGSMIYLEPGTVLIPNKNYEQNWGNTDFYGILEKYRPNNMLAHKDAVFMVGNDEDIDLSGGGTEWVFIVQPSSRIERHDINWSSEISALVSEGYTATSPEIKTAATNYWHGVPHPNEQVWEYLTPSAKILQVEPY